MTPAKWQETKAQIQQAFKDAEVFEEKLAEPEIGTIETLEFTGPMGRMLLEYTTKPLIIDKHVVGSRRIGSHHETKYVYSDTEMSHVLTAYKWDSELDDWVEINLKNSFSL